MSKAMAERMANKIRVAKIFVGEFDNKRECPFYSELKGMEQALNTLGIPFHYEFNSCYEISAVNVDGSRVEI